MEVIKIKNIITAIGNPIINNKLRELNNLNILNKDIQYQDGIFEILEFNKNIDFLILSQLLPGELKLEELIEKIQENNKKIKIIIILEKINNELEKVLLKKGIYKIIYNNEIKIENILKIINVDDKMEKYNEEIKKEIDELKKIIISNKYSKNKEEKTKNKIINNKKNNKLIISFLGCGGVGKSTISAIIAKELKKQFNKILMIDFNFFNNNLHTIFGVKELPKKYKNNIYDNKNIFELIIKIDSKIDLISKINLIFNNKFDYKKLKDTIDELLKKYDLIIFDTTSEYYFDFTKEIINISDKCIFIAENNLLGINNSKKLLNKYINSWQINKEKINIIFNKCNKVKINYNLIKNIYLEYKIMGFIKYFKYYNLLINKNLKINYYFNLKKITKKIIYN